MTAVSTQTKRALVVGSIQARNPTNFSLNADIYAINSACKTTPHTFTKFRRMKKSPPQLLAFRI